MWNGYVCIWMVVVCSLCLRGEVKVSVVMCVSSRIKIVCIVSAVRGVNIIICMV